MTVANIRCFKRFELIFAVGILSHVVGAMSIDGTINITTTPSLAFTNAVDQATTYVKAALGAGFRVVALENHRMLTNEWWRVEAINDASRSAMFDLFSKQIVRLDNTSDGVVRNRASVSLQPVMEAYRSMASDYPGHGAVLAARADIESNLWYFVCTDAMYIQDRGKCWMRKANLHSYRQAVTNDICVEVTFGSPLSGVGK